MNVEVSRLPESRAALTIVLTPQEVEQALDRTYKQLVQRITVPGFRKGKAPRAILERMVGHEVFVHEATEEAMRWGYRKAVDQAKITPIDEAEIGEADDSHSHLESGQEFRFSATVTVKPEVQLPDLKTIEVERTTVEVTDADVDTLLGTLRERNAALEPVVRPAQIGDVVTLNISGRVDGEEVLNNENADFEIADETQGDVDVTLPGLSRELVGINRGDIREIPLQLPATYANTELAGKSLFTRVLVKEIKRKVLPELDDEFAQTVSEFQTLEELRQALRSNIEIERKMEADEKLVTEALEAVTSRTFIEIPSVLVEEELDRMLDDMRSTFERSRVSLDVYLEQAGKSEEDLRQDMREGATQNTKRSLVLGAVADAEGIEVSGREIDAALEEILRGMNTNSAERRNLRSSNAVRSNIRSRLRRQRATQKLVEIVTGGEEISPEAADAITDQTAATADDTQETLAVEVGG